MKALSSLLFFLFMLLGLVGLAAAPDQPEPARDNDSWGPIVDGLTCRVTVAGKDFIPGQAIPAVVEVRNVSEKERFIVPDLRFLYRKATETTLTDPRGRKLTQQYYGESGLRPNSFQRLAAGEVLRVEMADIGAYYNDLQYWDPKSRAEKRPLAWPADSPKYGKYTLSIRFTSPKVPEKFHIGSEFGNDGKIVRELYEKPIEIVVTNQWANTIVAKTVSFELRPPRKDDLIVHEWGVFTVFNDLKYANINRKAEWGALPDFFYRQFPKEQLRWSPAAWDKPIIYFYAKPKTMNVVTTVSFGEGAPVAWWPCAAKPIDDHLPVNPGTRPFHALTWDVWLGEEVPSNSINGGLADPGSLTKVKEFPLPEGCWLADVRLPKATPLTVVGSDPLKVGRRGNADRPETERFLYYDGLVPAPAYLRCEKIEAGAITLRNKAKFDLGPLFVVDRCKNATGFAVRAGKDALKAGAVVKIEPTPIPAKDWPETGVKAVRQALLAAGLFDAEADALLKIYQQGFFENEGVTVFHLLPQSEYDRMLPLQLQPVPLAKPVRVGVALHPHVEIEPDLTAKALGLIRQLDDEDFDVREKASKALVELGPLAAQLVRDAMAKSDSVEMKRRAKEILDHVDASELLKNVVPATPKK